MRSTATLASLHHIYFSTLLDVSIIVVFLFLFKVVLFYFMLLFGKTIQDDASQTPKQVTPKRRFWDFWHSQEHGGVPEASGRKALWIGLGLFWLASGLVQINPIMVNHSVTAVIGRMSLAQPHWVLGTLHALGQLWATHPAWFNILSIFVQVAIGSLILFYRNSLAGYVGLWLALPWSLGIWVFSEGFGHIFSKNASLILGSPGAAFMSLLCTAYLLIPTHVWDRQAYHNTRRFAYLFIWLLIVGLHILPNSPFWHAGDFSKFADLATNGTHGFWVAFSHGISQFIGSWIMTYNVLFTVVSLTLTGFVVFKGNSMATFLAALWLIILWMIGGFGLEGSMGANLGPIPLLTAYTLSLYSDSKRSRLAA